MVAGCPRGAGWDAQTNDGQNRKRCRKTDCNVSQEIEDCAVHGHKEDYGIRACRLQSYASTQR
jgi:hypothetical protein